MMKSTTKPTATTIVVAVVSLMAGTLAMMAPRAQAQMPGQPVLQNAFANPGLTVGIDFGEQSGVSGFGGALAWAPGGARFQLSGGGGVVRSSGSSAGAWGVRAMVPVLHLMTGQLGVAVFGGAGGSSKSGSSLLSTPVGAAVGYRRALGATRGISIYVAPFYRHSRVSGGGESLSDGSFRISGGVDIAIIPALGLTVGYEGGSDNKVESGGIFGVGLSYALRRPR